MKKIFLESHHIDNPYFGFGQFNLHLLKALTAIEQEEIQFVIHGSNIGDLREKFGDRHVYKKYFSFRRYRFARIRKSYDLWHSLNQNTKIEPFYNLPYLLTVHNITFIKDPENYREEKVHQLFQQKIRRSSAITYISEYAKSSTHEFFDVPKVAEKVIYNGNPIEKIDLAENFGPKIKPQRPFLFTIGEITARKNFAALLGMLKFFPEYDLIIAGKDSTATAAELKKEVANQKWQDRVYFPAKIPEEEKQWYYKNCEAFVFPSLREGFGLPVIEAMRFAKPVFTSNNTSLPEIGGDLAFYWNSFEAEYMAEVLKKGMDHFRRNKKAMETRMLQRANQFNWNKAAAEYMDLYRTLI